MDIGKPKREIESEPIKNPVPEKNPKTAPTPDKPKPKEPVKV